MVNYLSTPIEPIHNMATRVGLGVPLRMTPATATWALPFAAYYIFLQDRVVFQRFSSKTVVGDTSDTNKGAKDPLYLAARAQGNFSENVPLVLAIALLAELNGANRTFINSALGTLFALRIGHAEFGLLAKDALGRGRPIGFLGTQAVLASLAGYTAYLIKDYWLA
ncbi:MAPEG family-domain-containing protein [Phaeosphaeriaceae sp. PMI808]|nr:MAPEG family-domain-containing protein [Phaeosphaeriaceae sp. PMI808]